MRDAAPPAGVSTPASRGDGWRTRHAAVVGGVASLAIVVSIAVLWRSADGPQTPQIVLRGRGGDLPLIAVRRPDGRIRLSWPRLPKAVDYEVRVSAGSVRLVRSVTQPSLELDPSAFTGAGEPVVTVDAQVEAAEHLVRTTTLRTARPAR